LPTAVRQGDPAPTRNPGIAVDCVVRRAGLYPADAILGRAGLHSR